MDFEKINSVQNRFFELALTFNIIQYILYDCFSDPLDLIVYSV